MNRRSPRRELLLLCLFLTIGVAVHVLAPTANGLKIAGLPMGYWLAAQLGPLLLAFILVWLSADTRQVPTPATGQSAPPEPKTAEHPA